MVPILDIQLRTPFITKYFVKTLIPSRDLIDFRPICIMGNGRRAKRVDPNRMNVKFIADRELDFNRISHRTAVSLVPRPTRAILISQSRIENFYGARCRADDYVKDQSDTIKLIGGYHFGTLHYIKGLDRCSDQVLSNFLLR